MPVFPPPPPSPPRLLAGSDQWRTFSSLADAGKCLEWTTDILKVMQCDQTKTEQRWHATTNSPTVDTPAQIISAHDG